MSRDMLSAFYMGQEHIEVRRKPIPRVGAYDVLIHNIYSSICGTDVAVYTKGPETGHHITVGGEFGHETISRIAAVGEKVTDFQIGQRVYPYPRFTKGETSMAGTIGIAAAICLKWFGIEKIMICDLSDFRLDIIARMGFEVCNSGYEDFVSKAAAYFGTAPALLETTADIDIFIDAAGSESILDLFMESGKIESRFVSVAVNNAIRKLDLLNLTFAQKSIIGSGGYMPQDVSDVISVMKSGKWDISSIITHEFPLCEIEKAIQTAADPHCALNVIIGVGVCT